MRHGAYRDPEGVVSYKAFRDTRFYRVVKEFVKGLLKMCQSPSNVVWKSFNKLRGVFQNLQRSWKALKLVFEKAV